MKIVIVDSGAISREKIKEILKEVPGKFEVISLENNTFSIEDSLKIKEASIIYNCIDSPNLVLADFVNTHGNIEIVNINKENKQISVIGHDFPKKIDFPILQTKIFESSDIFFIEEKIFSNIPQKQKLRKNLSSKKAKTFFRRNKHL